MRASAVVPASVCCDNRPVRASCGFDDVHALERTDHVCWAYASDDDYESTLRAFVADGVSREERVLVMPRPGKVAAMTALLAEAGHAVGGLDAKVAVVSVDDVQVPGGTLNPPARLEGFGAAAETALRDRFQGLRVFGDVTDRLSEPSMALRWAGYELRADVRTARRPLTILCGADVRECTGRHLDLVAAVHPGKLDRHHALGPRFGLHATDEGALRLEGELDLADAPVVECLLDDALADLTTPVLDVAELDFADVAGCRVLARALRQLRRVHGHSALVGASEELRRVWALLGYGDFVDARAQAA